MFKTYGQTIGRSSSVFLDTLSIATVAPPLPAGAYTLEFAMDGYRSRTVEAVLEAGVTTWVDVTLVR